MIQRVVMIRLKSDLRSDADLRQVAQHTREVLGTLPEVRGLDVGVPADERARREWDLCILVRFEDLDAVERYRVGEVHRKYVDIYLKPMMDGIRAYNFELA